MAMIRGWVFGHSEFHALFPLKVYSLQSLVGTSSAYYTGGSIFNSRRRHFYGSIASYVTRPFLGLKGATTNASEKNKKQP